MTLKEYAKAINKLLRDEPQYANSEVYYASDDEGNSFNKVYYEPSIQAIPEVGSVVIIN